MLPLLATGQREERKIPSGSQMTATKMVRDVKRIAKDWTYGRVSIGYPGPVIHGGPLHEPYNLGCGWVGFNFVKAFGCPVKIVNDAAMQALGSYQGSRMLFLGLGAGLGSAMIVDGIVEPMELAHLPYKKGRTFEDYVGVRGLARAGKKKWRRCVADVVKRLKDALEAEYVVLGGGSVEEKDETSGWLVMGDCEPLILEGGIISTSPVFTWPTRLSRTNGGWRGSR